MVLLVDDIVEEATIDMLGAIPPMDMDIVMAIELMGPLEAGIGPESLSDIDCGTLDTCAEELPEHEPKYGWQPVPQNASLLPQYPYSLQQSPKPDPKQVQPPLVLPHSPLSETKLAAEGLADGAAA